MHASAQQVARLGQARHEDVHRGQDTLQERPPAHRALPGIEIRIGHVERRRQALTARPFQEAPQLPPVVRHHRRHERRVADVQEGRGAEQLVRHVVPCEGVVDAREVLDRPIPSRQVRDEAVRRRLTGRDDQPGRVAGDRLAHELGQHAPQAIVAHACHER